MFSDPSILVSNAGVMFADLRASVVILRALENSSRSRVLQVDYVHVVFFLKTKTCLIGLKAPARL